ncbi:hypothetical protein TIFTF001_008628 [Ficus carica]|uniref:Uncharacterized protein n=1 Tax=Ficus carica TaxID=3494 RepID=A0AA87ZLQ8_FICCA|nr:hypothetical protein TIFTF001_008628 [Ficus carica]
MNVKDVKRDMIFSRARGGWGRELPRRVGDVRRRCTEEILSFMEDATVISAGVGSIKREWKRENGDPSYRRK